MRIAFQTLNLEMLKLNLFDDFQHEFLLCSEFSLLKFNVQNLAAFQ